MSGEDDIPVYQLDGAAVPIQLKPAELRNEVQNVSHQIIRDIGLNREKLMAFKTYMEDWARTEIYNTSNNSLTPFHSATFIGRPRTSRIVGFQEGKVKARANGSRVKKKYACGKCGKMGHTAPKCSQPSLGKRARDDDDDKFLCQYCHKTCKNAQGLSTHITRKHKGAKKSNVGADEEEK